jgi:nicotinate dehydrogenase subunit A
MVAFVLNGRETDLDVDPDTPLLYVLRNELGLMGARFGCGLGLCGACFVHVDGVSVPSCDTPMWSLSGKSVVTIEGLTPHPVQQAFLDEQAAQCGYCVTGIIMSAAALLDREPHPTESVVAEALDRHLCRCGAQERMVRAVVSAGQSKSRSRNEGAGESDG